MRKQLAIFGLSSYELELQMMMFLSNTSFSLDSHYSLCWLQQGASLQQRNLFDDFSERWRTFSIPISKWRWGDVEDMIVHHIVTFIFWYLIDRYARASTGRNHLLLLPVILPTVLSIPGHDQLGQQHSVQRLLLTGVVLIFIVPHIIIMGTGFIIIMLITWRFCTIITDGMVAVFILLDKWNEVVLVLLVPHSERALSTYYLSNGQISTDWSDLGTSHGELNF